MAARFDDAKAGWQIWLIGVYPWPVMSSMPGSRPSAMPVSAPDVRALRELRRYGYGGTPINRLDESLKDPLWDEAVADGIRYPIPWSGDHVRGLPVEGCCGTTVELESGLCQPGEQARRPEAGETGFREEAPVGARGVRCSPKTSSGGRRRSPCKGM